MGGAAVADSEQRGGFDRLTRCSIKATGIRRCRRSDVTEVGEGRPAMLDGVELDDDSVQVRSKSPSKSPAS